MVAAANCWLAQAPASKLIQTRSSIAWQCPERGTIDLSLYGQIRGVLKQECLRSPRATRQSRHATQKGLKLHKINNAVPIGERPLDGEGRAGHWAGDLIVGSNNSYIATPVERHFRFGMLASVANKDTQSIVTTLITEARKLPKEMYRSLT